MRVLVLVVVLQWALAMDVPIMTKSSYKSTSNHCTPGYFRVVLDSGEMCIFCICWGDVETCGAMQYRKCLGDDVVVRSLRHKRNASILSYIDVLNKDSVRKSKPIKLDDVKSDKQREILIRSSKSNAFNARKLSADLDPTQDAGNIDGKRIIDNEMFGVFKRDGNKESEKILEEQQTLALIRNSKSRVIHTGNIMSVTSKPRFVRSHKKENSIKLNIKQKRTSYKKDLEKKFIKPSRYRTKRQVESSFDANIDSEKLLNATEKNFFKDDSTPTQSFTATTEEVTTVNAQKTSLNDVEETTVFDSETGKLSDVTAFYTTEQSTNTVDLEITKHLYDVTENVGIVADIDIPRHVNMIAENIPEANDIKFKDWSKLDTVEHNTTNTFRWTKEQVKELSAKDSILLNRFKRILRRKSNVIRTKPFTINKSERIYVTNVPTSSVANMKTKLPIAILKNITNIQYLLREILIRLKAAHVNEKFKEDKIDNDFIWRLKDHGRKIKKHSHLLKSYKNLGGCAINTSKKQIIDSKVNELHNHTKDIFESIEFLKNIPTAATTDRIIIKNNTKKFIKSVEKFAYLLNEIINIATCKRNNKLQRIIRHISRSQNPKVNEAVSKMKRLIGKYSAVQNTFVSKMYEAIHSFDDNTARVKSATAASYITNANNTAEMDAITMKITKNLMRLKDLLQNLNNGRKVKREVENKFILSNIPIKNSKFDIDVSGDKGYTSGSKDLSLRTKRDVLGDETMGMLLLVEYMLNQKNAVRQQPVEDGIDALIEAIRKAPDVRTVKNKILGINITDFNVSKATDEKDKKTRVNKHVDEDFDESNLIDSKIDRKNREANLSDMSSDDNSDERLDDDIKDLNENRSHEDVLGINKEMDKVDPSLEHYENIRPIEVDNNHVDNTTPAITIKVVSDSADSSESMENSQVEVNIANSDEHKKGEDDSLKDQKDNNIDC